MAGGFNTEELAFINKCINAAANEVYRETSSLCPDLSLGIDSVLAVPTDFKGRLKFARNVD